MGALSRDQSFRKRGAVCAAAAMVLAGSACSSSARSDTVGGAGADTDAAKATVVKYLEPMTAVDLPPVSQTPEPGKKIIFVVNNLPESGYIGDGAVEAGKLLGWD